MPLSVRWAQVEAIEAERLDGFVLRAVARLEHDWPASRPKLAPADLLSFVREAVRAGLGLGAHIERDLMLLVVLTVELGAGFLEDPSLPWVQVIVNDGTLDGSQKIELMVEGVIERSRGARG
jgi:hypothetical protein